MSRSVFPLQPLLFWQVLSLFWFCGLLAARHPVAGYILAAIIIFIDRRLWRILALLVALGIFLAGLFILDEHSEERAPAILDFTVRDNGIPIALRIQGRVLRVQSLADRRLRIFLQDVHVVDKPKTQSFPGLVVWTWEQKSEDIRHFLGETRPLVGQSVRITAKVMSTAGSRNFHGNDIGAYWREQNVFWRIWTQDAWGKPEFLGSGNRFALMREYVRTKFADALTHALTRANGHRDGTADRQGDTPAWQAKNHHLRVQALAFLPALLLYERYALNQDTLEKMQAVSLYHSLALSGQHLTFVVFYAIFLVYCIRFIRPEWFLYLPSPKFVGIISFPLALLYLWLGNAPISLIRASIMLFVGIIFFFKQKVINLTHMLLYAALLITIYSPKSFYNVGLQLSVLCVGSICLMLPWLRSISAQKNTVVVLQHIPWYTRFLRRLWRRTLQLFWLSLGIQVLLLPIFLLYFPPSGLWFVSNVLWLPILGIWILPLAALALMCAVCSLPAPAAFILNLAAFPCEMLLYVLQWMQETQLLALPALMRPHFSATLAFIVLFLALAMLVRRISWQSIKEGNAKIPPFIRRLSILGACLLCFAPMERYLDYRQSRLEVTLMDIGQGLAMHIRLPGGRSFLVDCGGSRSIRFDPGTDIVLPSMIYNRTPRLWAMFNTHPDLDHMRGLMHILPLISTEYFYHNGAEFSAYDKELWDGYAKNNQLPQSQVLQSGMEVPLPSLAHGNTRYAMEILSPRQNAVFKKSNNASLIMRLVRFSNHEKSQRKGLLLICGDAEIEALQELLQSGQDIQADVVIVPHHGAKDAFLPQFYAQVAPKLALVSAGRQNRFGHPHEVVRKALQRMHIPLKNTASSGAIKIYWNEENDESIKFQVVSRH